MPDIKDVKEWFDETIINDYNGKIFIKIVNNTDKTSTIHLRKKDGNGYDGYTLKNKASNDKNAFLYTASADRKEITFYYWKFICMENKIREIKSISKGSWRKGYDITVFYGDSDCPLRF